MRLKIRRPNAREVTLDGPAARTELKVVLHQIGQSILIPEPPFTGLIRRRAIDALKAGRPIWTETTHLGFPTDTATVVVLLTKIVGVIRADGTWDGAGPDPRLSDAEDEVLDRAGTGDRAAPPVAPKP